MVKKTSKKLVRKVSLEAPVPQRVVKKDFSGLYAPVLVILLIVASFFLGRLSSQVEKLGKTDSGNTVNNGAPTAPQRPLDVQSMKDKAKRFGLNMDQFNQCLDSGKMASRVAAEQKEGQALGVNGTPTFFINGLIIVGAQPQSSFESVIDAELKDGSGEKAASALFDTVKRVKLNLTDGYVLGDANAPVKIVEFTDFECPFCEAAYPTITALMQKYAGKISLEYKSYPLPFHSSAQKAAEAALCAGEQGKFWEMHDDIFAPAK